MQPVPSRAERRAEAQRLLAGVTASYVADALSKLRCETVAPSTINSWRAGTRIPSLDDLLLLPAATGRPMLPELRERLARILSGDVMAGGDDEPGKPSAAEHLG
jgi:hypothetical protein